jgi:hypothetical protein
MATSLEPLRIRRVLGRGNWTTPAPFGPDGWKMVALDGASSVIVSCAPALDGDEWVHASIARRDEMPSYADLKLLHAAVFDGGWAYQVFAPPSDHVNIHEYALHLFGRLDGQPALPDFTRGLGSI